MRFSTGAVRDYASNGCSGSDLPLTIPEAQAFAAWYLSAGHTAVTRWDNGNVWGADFRDDGGDIDPSGGSELPNVYFYTGHGSCQAHPLAPLPDFIIVCSNFGKPNNVNIRIRSGWGNAPGGLDFLFLDASCPMDLVSIMHNWFPPLKGLHMATGHSGTVFADTLDSAVRGSQFAVRTVGSLFSWLIPQQSVGDAWMDTGTIDIPPGCSAVAVAAGATGAEAVDRRENERVTDGRPDPTVTQWIAWKWRSG
jgi:hypothetical protein